MNLFFTICVSLSVGIAVGVIIGGIKSARFRKTYSQEKIERVHRVLRKLAAVLKYATFLLLAIGFIWCVYFLVLGAMQPERAEYANNLSELIVAVLTVISILFAFLEFINRKDGGR